MGAIKMPEEIDRHRRRFLGTAAMTIAAAELGVIGAANAQSGETHPAAIPPIKPGTNKSFGSLKQIDAGLLNIGYAEAGPADGSAVILLHGWPYDIHSYVDVAPLLAAAGYRVIVPYVRLRHDALPVEYNDPERPAVGSRSRCHCFDGRSQDREGDPRRF